MTRTTLIGILACFLFAGPLFAQETAAKKKVLYFSLSQGFEHDPVKLVDGGPSISDVALTQLGQKRDFEVVCTKDGSVFDGDLNPYDAILFYTSGNLLHDPKDTPGKKMSEAGRDKLFGAIRSGKGFVAFHSGNDTWRSGGDNFVNDPPEKINPYIKILGGEFTSHGPQQEADLILPQPSDFPWLKTRGEKFRYWDEWYAFKNFASDLRVLAVIDTAGMKGDQYKRPPFPMIWARMEEKGRVLYSGLGHRNEFWQDENMMELVGDLLEWPLGRREIDLTPNMKDVAPGATTLKNP